MIVVHFVETGDSTFPEVAVVPPSDFIYAPNYCQYFFPHLGGNRERNVGVIATAGFTKDHAHTVLRVAWIGNFRKSACTNCCIKWSIHIDGSPCSDAEPIETSIRSGQLAQDIFAPTTITGVCSKTADLPISTGAHKIRLLVERCEGFRDYGNTATGFFSTSRLIVDEIPRREPLR